MQKKKRKNKWQRSVSLAQLGKSASRKELVCTICTHTHTHTRVKYTQLFLIHTLICAWIERKRMCKFITATGNGIESARHLCTSVAAKWLFARRGSRVACGANEKWVQRYIYTFVWVCRRWKHWSRVGKRSGSWRHPWRKQMYG